MPTNHMTRRRSPTWLASSRVASAMKEVVSGDAGGAREGSAHKMQGPRAVRRLVQEAVLVGDVFGAEHVKLGVPLEAVMFEVLQAVRQSPQRVDCHGRLAGGTASAEAEAEATDRMK